jgi:hypothetical protein
MDSATTSIIELTQLIGNSAWRMGISAMAHPAGVGLRIRDQAYGRSILEA